MEIFILADSVLPPEQHIVEKLLELGGQAGLLWLAIWFLVRTLKDQYDARISALEGKSEECERDRQALHAQIHELQGQRIELLEGLIRDTRHPQNEQG